MIAGSIIDLAVGLTCIILGLLIWKKQKISILHSYHYKNVKQEDIPAYTRLMGIGNIIIGAGICLTGLLNIACPKAWWIPMVGGFVVGFIIIYKAQKKYNGSVMG